LTVNNKNLNLIEQDLKNYNARLLIVSKNQNQQDIKLLHNMGYRYFAENRVQEAKVKYPPMNLQDLNLSLIGPLQTNKVSDALKIFDVIQSLDREKIVQEIIKQKSKLLITKTKSFFIQINIGEEEQKSGISIKYAKDFYHYCLSQNFNIVGLMCIPPNDLNPDFYFKKMVALKSDIQSKLLLSMGMSGDYKIALKNNSDIIRIGSMIFNNEV